MIFHGKAFFDEVTLLYFINTVQFVAVVYRIYCVQTEFLNILGIRMFSVKTEEEKKKKS